MTFKIFVWPLGTFWTLWTEFEPSRGKVAGRVVKIGPKVAAALSRERPAPAGGTPGTAQGEDNRRGKRTNNDTTRLLTPRGRRI